MIKGQNQLFKRQSQYHILLSEWASPILPVKKSYGSIRICGDYRVSINKVAKRDKYPVPKTEDLLATLNGGKRFSILHLSHAYQQVLLHEDSKELLTVNTQKCLFQPNRLQYGIHSVVAIFQRIPCRIVRIDDILILGKINEENLQNLEKVILILHKHWIRKLKKAKCIFFSKEVTYLRFPINEYGVFPVKEKIEELLNAKSPENVTQMKLFLGMMNYYRRHLPHLASVLKHLHNLLRNNIKRRWGRKERNSFKKVKELLCSLKLLVYYINSLALIACDVSPNEKLLVMLHPTRLELFCPINIQTILKDQYHTCLRVYHQPKRIIRKLKRRAWQ